MDSSRRARGLLIGVAAAFVLLIVGVSVGIMIWNKIFSATIDFLVAPSDSKILMNGEQVTNGERKIRPGEYDIEISREGFDAETQHVAVKEGETKVVYVVLNPNDPSTMDWYETHEEDATIADGVVGLEFAEAALEMTEEYDILEDLPVYKYNYILGYGTCEDSGGPDFCVVVDADFGYRDEAVKYLQNTGKEISKYYVEFVDFSSPFSQISIEVPDGLTYDSNANSELDTQVLETESEAINAVIYGRIANLANDYDMAKLSTIKCFGGGKFCGVKVAIYDEELYDQATLEEEEGDTINPDNTLHDTYRMVIAKVNDSWRLVSDLKFLLDYDTNPKLPKEVVKLVNEL